MKTYKIQKIEEHSDLIRSFYVDDFLVTGPGMFVMVGIPGIGEKPMSLSGRGRFTVKKVGRFTKELFQKDEGDYITLRNPRGFVYNERAETLIGGGMGIAPLAASRVSHKNIVIAGKTIDDIIFKDEFEMMLTNKGNFSVYTEDGSMGKKGIIIDHDFSKCEGPYLICGPELMMEAVAEKINKPKSTWLIMERYMKCGVGLCGACSCSGYRVCVDGPVMRYDILKGTEHFGKLKRKKNGELVELK
ncbi:hypothetical protein KY330_00975 [Candidatus Woesearchaeota archaeon]|nr:hypothetical protein [Candidatus Woesearchaeota archaeon]